MATPTLIKFEIRNRTIGSRNVRQGFISSLPRLKRRPIDMAKPANDNTLAQEMDDAIPF